MRKRIAIGLLAAVVIGVGLYVLWPPRKETVEYHRKQYTKLVMGNRWTERLRQSWAKLRGRRVVVRTPSEQEYKQLKLHEAALIKLGYFEERRFLVFNRPSDKVTTRAVDLWKDTQTNPIVRRQFDEMFVAGGNGSREMGSIRSIGAPAGGLAESLVIVTQPEHMPHWAELVHRTDSASPTNMALKRVFVPVRR
jgi:hypothetical protein